MTTPRLLHTTGGPLLTALLLLTGYASAQPPPLTLTLLCEGLADPNGLVIGGGGVLYGTTNAGGGIGQAYSLTPPGAPGAPWAFTWAPQFRGPRRRPSHRRFGDWQGRGALRRHAPRRRRQLLTRGLWRGVRVDSAGVFRRHLELQGALQVYD